MLDNKKKNSLRKFLATASAFAIIAGGAGEAGAAAARRTANANRANLNGGGGLAGGGAFTDGSTLEFVAARDVLLNRANLVIRAIDTHGIDVAGDGKFMIVNEDASVGSIVDLGGAGNALALPAAANRVNIRFDAVKVVTLTGTDSNPGIGGVGFAAHPASVNLDENAPANDYSALGEINFNGLVGGASTLRINAAAPLIFAPTTTVANANGNGAILDLHTDLTVNDASFAKIDSTLLGNGVFGGGGVAANLTINTKGANIATTATSTYTSANTNSTLTYNVDLLDGARQIKFLADVVDTAVGNNKFKLSFGATDNLNPGNHALTVTSFGPRNIGTDPANRLTELRLTGTENIIFDANMSVFATDISQAGTGVTTFTNAVNSGAGSALFLGAAGEVFFSNGATITNIALTNGGIVTVDGAALTANITSRAGGGTVTVNDVAGIVGGINLAAGGTVVTTAAGTINGGMILGNGAAIGAAGLATGNVTFAAGGGTMTAGAGLNGNVDFTGNAGRVNLTGKLDGAVANGIAGGATLGVAAGGGRVTGAVVAAHVVADGNAQFDAAVNATDVTLGAVGTIVRVDNLLTARDINFTADSTLDARAGITGDVDFAGNAGTVTVRGVIDGNVDNKGAAANSILTFAAVGGGVNQKIGDTRPLHEVNFNAGGNAVTLGNAANARTFKFLAADTVTAAGDIEGAIDFNNQAGRFSLGNGQTITGAVDSVAVGANGTLIFGDGGVVDGAIGANHPLTLIDARGTGAVTLGNGNAVNATQIRVGHPTAIITTSGNTQAELLFAASGGYILDGAAVKTFTGNANFNGHDGQIFISDGNIWAGNISNNQTAVFDFADAVAVAKDAAGVADAITMEAFIAAGNGATPEAQHAAAVLLARGGVLTADDILTAAMNAMGGDITLVGTALTPGGGGAAVAATDNRKPLLNVSVGILTLEGDGTVTGLVGDDTANPNSQTPLKLVELIGGNGTVGTFDVAVKTKELALRAGADATLTKGAVIDKLTIGNADSHVNIANNQTLEFTGREIAIAFPGDSIVFAGAGSTLKFNAVGGAQVAAAIDTAALNSGANNKGIIILNSDGNNGIGPNPTPSRLTITGQAIGGADKFKSITATGDSTIELNVPIRTIALNVDAGTSLVTTNTTDIAITTIAAGGSFTYSGNIPAINISPTRFAHANSTLALQASAGVQRTFTLQQNINPNGAGQGTVILDSNGAGAQVRTRV